MGKSRKNVKSVMKSITKSLPVVNNGLKSVGKTAENVAKNSAPVIEKGMSAIYGTMATGFDLGIKGAKSVANGITKRRKSKSHGGRRHRRRHTRRRSHRRH